MKVLFVHWSFICFAFTEKNQLLMDFLKMIKDSAELSKVYEYVQKDIAANSIEASMDQS